jgi:hypothetical protein
MTNDPSHFYHVARRSNLDSILFHGLLPADDDIAGIMRLGVLRATDDPLPNWDRTPAVNLLDDLDHWKCDDDAVVLTVAIDTADPKLQHVAWFWWRYKGVIRPDRISVSQKENAT